MRPATHGKDVDCSPVAFRSLSANRCIVDWCCTVPCAVQPIVLWTGAVQFHVLLNPVYCGLVLYSSMCCSTHCVVDWCCTGPCSVQPIVLWTGAVQVHVLFNPLCCGLVLYSSMCC